jgi:hypothetical protein
MSNPSGGAKDLLATSAIAVMLVALVAVSPWRSEHPVSRHQHGVVDVGTPKFNLRTAAPHAGRVYDDDLKLNETDYGVEIVPPREPVDEPDARPIM